MSETILITGATGKIGTEATRLAAARGHQVRAATRDPLGGRARALQALDPELITPVPFDADDDSVLDAAFDGVTGLFLIAPPGDDVVGWHQAVAAAGARAGVGFCVKVSVTGARGPDSDPPPGGLPLKHWQGEEAVRESGVRTCAIRPTIFAQHLFMGTGMYTQGDDKLYLPTGAAQIAWLDCRDIASCGVALLEHDEDERDDWNGRAFELTGPQGVTGAELAELLSWVRGSEVTWVDGMGAFEARCKELGKPDGVKAIYGEAAGGWFGEVFNDELEELCGRKASPIARVVLDQAYYFR